jgi:hypothetical protein
MIHPRTKSILKFCSKPGAYLRKEHQSRCRKNGGGQPVMVKFYLEPGTVEVKETYALEAIRTGLIIPRDTGLFADDPGNAQSWYAPLRRPIPSRKSPAPKRAGLKSLHPEETAS